MAYIYVRVAIMSINSLGILLFTNMKVFAYCIIHFAYMYEFSDTYIEQLISYLCKYTFVIV